MNTLPPKNLVSFSEIALFVFAIFLLAAAPAKKIIESPAEQPVKVTVPVDQDEQLLVKSA